LPDFNYYLFPYYSIIPIFYQWFIKQCKDQAENSLTNIVLNSIFI
jgi:hypothetical protein